MISLTKTIKSKFRQVRKKIIRIWRMNAAIPKLLRYNPYTGFIGRKLFYYIPFLLPHDKSYYGFMHLVKPGDGLFLDVGANDGISAIGFRHIHSDYRILSIEPNPCHERSLRKVKRVLKRFDFLMVGAGRGPSQMTLYIPIYNGVPIYTAASLNRDYVYRTMMEQHLPGATDKNIVIFECKVDVIALDKLSLRPDVIKIDTEGFDYEVLLGLKKTIETCRPTVLIEHNPALMKDIESFFDGLQYDLLTYEYTQDKFFPLEEKVAANVFCVPKERVKGLPHFNDGA